MSNLEMENLKKHSISAISILIAVVFSIISITFAWYTRNRDVSGSTNGIKVSDKATQTMAIINQGELSDNISFNVENLMFVRPNFEHQITSVREYIEITNWRIRSFSEDKRYETQDIENFVYNNSFQMAFFNVDGNYENDFKIACDVSAFYADDNTPVYDVSYAIGLITSDKKAFEYINFCRIRKSDGLDFYIQRAVIESSNDYRTECSFKIFIWKDLSSEDDGRNRPINLKIEFKFQ